MNHRPKCSEHPDAPVLAEGAPGPKSWTCAMCRTVLATAPPTPFPLVAVRDIPEPKTDRRVLSMLEHLRCNGDPDADEQDAWDALAQACGQMPDGSCNLAGSEQCDFECPYRDLDTAS